MADMPKEKIFSGKVTQLNYLDWGASSAENLVMLPLFFVLMEFGRKPRSHWVGLIGEIVFRLLRNPLIVSIFAGLAFAASGLRLPLPLARTLDMVSVASAPVALFYIGSTLSGIRLQGMVRDIGTVDSYWQANMDLIVDLPSLNLYDLENEIRTATHTNPPVKLGPHATVRRSLVANGAIINGTVWSSIISPHVYVEGGAVVTESIIFDDTHIGRDTKSTIVSKGISAGHGSNTYRGQVKILPGARGEKLLAVRFPSDRQRLQRAHLPVYRGEERQGAHGARGLHVQDRGGSDLLLQTAWSLDGRCGEHDCQWIL
jgi:hypothetical protein